MPSPGENPRRGWSVMSNKLRDGLAIGLFVILDGYVTFSGIRLGLLLWERFG